MPRSPLFPHSGVRRLGPLARVAVPLTVLGGVVASVTAVAVTDPAPAAVSLTAFELSRQTTSAAGAPLTGGGQMSSELALDGAPGRADAAAGQSAAEKLREEAQAQAEADVAAAARKAAAEKEAARVQEAAREQAAREKAAAARAEQARAQAVAQAARDSARDPRSLGRAMAADRGWGDSQFSCLDALWQKESGWKLTARNPSSGAYGIPQSLPGSKMAAAGSDWQTNPATQIEWGLDYIAERYGTPCGAWSHSQATNWY